ncbi:hypothetical protein SGPA1_12449 [Streptomyces misionensis JCM 4497]
MADLHQLAPAARAARDPGLLGQFPDGDAPGAREPVPLGHQGHQAVGQQGAHHQVVPVLGDRRPLVAEGQREVAVALAQQLDGARGLGLLQGDPGAGVGGAQGGQGGGDEGGAAAREGDQADPAGPQARDGGDLLLGGGESGEDAGGVPDQGLAGLGQPHLAAGADQQRGADRGLQGLHLLAHGGLGAAQLAPGGREGAGGGDGAQDTEMTGLDHPSSIRQAWGPHRIIARRFEEDLVRCGHGTSLGQRRAAAPGAVHGPGGGRHRHRQAAGDRPGAGVGAGPQGHRRERAGRGRGVRPAPSRR